tara:strand:- start:6733 stop:10074 length:3342 start_codon:yes stop_codon:yes gene_type:complete
MKSIFVLFCFGLGTVAHTQTTLFSDDFETPTALWNSFGSINPNLWLIDNCSGNGPSLAGGNAMYISDNSAGCGVTNNEQYAYSNSLVGSDSVINYVSINASCLNNLSLSFDFKIDAIGDIGELVYSTDAGVTWNVIGTSYTSTPNWTSTSLTLPAVLEGTVFWLGFRFIYDNTESSLNPFSIDNVLLTGMDITAPIIICPAVVPLYVDASCTATIIDYTALASAVDVCLGLPTVTQTPLPGTLINVNDSPTIVLTATDAAGNQSQCSFTQTIFDSVSPSVTCPGTQNVIMTSNCDAIIGDYLALASSSDNCSALGVVTLSQSPSSGLTIGASTNISIVATDASGNTSTCNFFLQTLDTISPTVTCPNDSTVSTDVGCDYNLVDFSTSSVGLDNCSLPATLTYSQSPPIGALLPVGLQTVTLTVQDTAGNIGICLFNLTVNDQISPIVSACVPNQSVFADVGCQGTLSDYSSLITATDNCSLIGNLVITQNPVSGTLISSTTLVTMTISDESGNSVDCQFSALISDTTSPVPVCPADFSLAINSSCQYTLPDLTDSVTGTDNCSVFGNMTVTQNPPVGSIGTGILPVLLTLIDEQGNQGTCITTISPIDITPPTVTCPTVPPVNNGTSCDYILPNYGSLTLVLDDCPNFTISQNPVSGTVVNPGMTPITILVTDAGGNSVSCPFNLLVLESQAPTISCPSNISQCNPVATFSDPIPSDNCFNYFYQIDGTGLSSGSNFPIGITTLQYEVADSSGNTSTCSFQVEILDFPSIANIAIDTIRVCDATSVLLDADPISSGTGQWSILSGGGNFNNQFVNSTGVNSLLNGENSFIWTVSSGSCGSLSDTVVVFTAISPIPASIPIDTMFACELSSIDLITGVVTNGNGLWTTDSDAFIVTPSSNVTTANMQSSGWQYFVWTVGNNGCPSTSDTLFVLSNLIPTILTSDTTICQEDDVNFPVTAGIPIADQTVLWEALSNLTSIVPSSSGMATLSNFDIGENIITYSVSIDGCPTVMDSLIVIATLCDGFDPVFPTLITPNLDGKNDLFEILYLEELFPECRLVIFNRWGSVVYESIGYEEPWDGTLNNERLPMGTYFFKLELNDDENRIYTGDISIIH